MSLPRNTRLFLVLLAIAIVTNVTLQWFYFRNIKAEDIAHMVAGIDDLLQRNNQQTNKRASTRKQVFGQSKKKHHSLGDSHREEQPKSLCLTPQCIENEGYALARPFRDRSDKSWISHVEQNDEGRREGIILVKVPKVASTTAASVVVNLAKAYNSTFRRGHGLANEENYGMRVQERSYMLGSVRLAHKRSISRVFFTGISIMGWKTKDQSIMHWLVREHRKFGGVSFGQGGFQLQYMSPEFIPHYSAWSADTPDIVLNPDQVKANVKRILDSYDIILLTERMDESLVAMAINMGVSVGNILTSASKKGGSYFDNHKRCIKIQPSFVSPGIQEYLDSPEWYARNYGDYLLHAAVNRSLDLTIAQIGQERFEANLAELKRLRELEAMRCAPFVEFPCSKDGQRQPDVSQKHCYLDDIGCGFRCINSLLRNESTRVLSPLVTPYELSNIPNWDYADNTNFF